MLLSDTIVVMSVCVTVLNMCTTRFCVPPHVRVMLMVSSYGSDGYAVKLAGDIRRHDFSLSAGITSMILIGLMFFFHNLT